MTPPPRNMVSSGTAVTWPLVNGSATAVNLIAIIKGLALFVAAKRPDGLSR